MASKWIPARQAVPANLKSVLLYLDYRDGYGGQAVGYYIGGQFWLHESENITCDEAEVDVIYWMPLPEPPAGAPLPP